MAPHTRFLTVPRGLRDRLAIATAEALAHGLDDLPAARNHLQRLGDVLAQLRQPGRSAARACLRRRDDDALAADAPERRGARAACARTRRPSRWTPRAPPARP